MKRFAKIYIEISNTCNLNCSFCPKTERPPCSMTKSEFETVLSKIKGYTEHIYFHLLGEPLLHPELESFLNIATKHNFKVIITTNGTLLGKKQEVLLKDNAHYKTVISLHSFEANAINCGLSFDEYLNNCLCYAKLANGKKTVVLRLWNSGGLESQNSYILSAVESRFKKPWKTTRDGFKINDTVYLQFGDKFDWPDTVETKENDNIFCYGLRDQIGILSDGRVVPCCLDNNGKLSLGNIFERELEDIINSPAATEIYNGFSARTAVAKLCKNCTYARKF